MYHQLIRTGKGNVLAEVDYVINRHEQIEIRKVTTWTGPDEEIDQVIPLGFIDEEQIERIEGLLYDGHDAVMRGLVDDARIDRYVENREIEEAFA